MQFKDLSDETLQRLGERMVRNATARVMRQIPQRGQNPFATGKLKNAFYFSWDKMPSGEWALNYNFGNAPYGKFTLFGTRQHRVPEQNLFAMRFTGYERAKGGIRAQGWISLNGDRPVYEAIVEAELRTTWQTFLNNTISDLGNRRR